MCLVPLREQLVKRGFDVTVTGQISSITLRSDYNKCLNVLRGTTTDQLYAQSGKHIKTSWVDGSGLQFNPDGVLVSDVTDLPVNAGANLKANPIVGYVVNTSSVGLSGFTVNLLNSKNVTVASATTDVSGFYYFPVTSGLTAGVGYTVKVTVPKAYRNSTPSSQSFIWRAIGQALSGTQFHPCKISAPS